MTKHFSDELISAYLDGELTAEQQALVEQELADRPEMRRLHDELRLLRQTLQEVPQVTPREDLADRILRSAERASLRNNGSETTLPIDDSAGTDSAAETVLVSRRWSWQAAVVTLTALAATVLLVLFIPPPKQTVTTNNPPPESSHFTSTDGSIADREVRGDPEERGDASFMPRENAADALGARIDQSGGENAPAPPSASQALADNGLEVFSPEPPPSDRHLADASERMEKLDIESRAAGIPQPQAGDFRYQTLEGVRSELVSVEQLMTQLNDNRVLAVRFEATPEQQPSWDETLSKALVKSRIDEANVTVDAFAGLAKKASLAAPEQQPELLGGKDQLQDLQEHVVYVNGTSEQIRTTLDSLLEEPGVQLLIEPSFKYPTLGDEDQLSFGSGGEGQPRFIVPELRQRAANVRGGASAATDDQPSRDPDDDAGDTPEGKNVNERTDRKLAAAGGGSGGRVGRSLGGGGFGAAGIGDALPEASYRRKLTLEYAKQWQSAQQQVQAGRAVRVLFVLQDPPSAGPQPAAESTPADASTPADKVPDK